MANYLKKMIVLSIFLLLVIFSGCNMPENSSSPDNIKVEEALKNEFSMIPIMPSSAEHKRHFTKKTELMGISATYATNHSCKEITDFYDAQLKKHGWQFYREEEVTDWGKDYGGKIVRYKKGDFVATVQYAGEEADYGWTYAFGMDWGKRYE